MTKRQTLFVNSTLLVSLIGVGWITFSPNRLQVFAKDVPQPSNSIYQADVTVPQVDKQDYQLMIDMMQQHHGNDWQDCANSTEQLQEKTQST
jgi:hypothetical protein